MLKLGTAFKQFEVLGFPGFGRDRGISGIPGIPHFTNNEGSGRDFRDPQFTNNEGFQGSQGSPILPTTRDPEGI